MADEPKTDPPATGGTDPGTDPPADLGDAGRKALEAERKARRDAEKQLKDVQARLREIEDRDKSEAEKLAEKAAAAEAKAQEAEARVLRLEVGASKGLTAAQTRRLVGTTREELEADADDLLESLRPAGDDTSNGGARPPSKPTENLRGGGDPTEEPTVDIRKIVEAIPRSF